MGTLNDWRKVMDGPFTGRIALTKWYIYDQGELIRCLLRDKQGNIWHVQEQFSVTGNRRTTILEKTKLNDNVAIDEVNFWVRPYRTHGINTVILGRGNDQKLYIYDDTGIDRWVLLDENGRFPANALNRDALIGRGVNNNVWVGHTEHAESRDVQWQNVGGDVRGRPSHVADVMLLAVDGQTRVTYNVVTPQGRDAHYSGWMAMHRSSFADNPLLVSLPGRAGAERVMMIGHGTPEHRLWSRKWSRGEGWENDWYDHDEIATPQSKIKGEPTVAHLRPGHIFCFVRGADDALWCLPYEDDQWQTWQNWGGELANDPAALTQTVAELNSPSWTYYLRAFAIGSDGGLWERSYTFSADEIS